LQKKPGETEKARRDEDCRAAWLLGSKDDEYRGNEGKDNRPKPDTAIKACLEQSRSKLCVIGGSEP
jgi:hypothetical protein